MTAAHTGLYEALGVPADADAKTIKRAYRKRAAELHPDRNPGEDTTAAFNSVQAAYDVLSDPNRRKRYDDTGDATTGPTPADVERVIAELFTQTLTRLVSQVSVYCRLPDFDLVKEVRNNLESQLRQAKEALNKSRQVLTDLGNMVGRFDGPANNPFDAVVTEQTTRCRNHVYALERDVTLLTQAVDYVKKCAFKPIKKLDGEGGRTPIPQSYFHFWTPE